MQHTQATDGRAQSEWCGVVALILPRALSQPRKRERNTKRALITTQAGLIVFYVKALGSTPPPLSYSVDHICIALANDGSKLSTIVSIACITTSVETALKRSK